MVVRLESFSSVRLFFVFGIPPNVILVHVADCAPPFIFSPLFFLFFFLFFVCVCVCVCVCECVLRELLLDGVAVTAAVRPASVEKANSIFSDASFMPQGGWATHASTA